MSEKKPSTFDIPCLCISFAVALCALFYTDPEYPISTALDCFLSAMLLLGWLRLAVFVVRWCVTRTIPYWRWRSIVLHTACFFAVCGGVVLEGGGPGLVAAGEIVGFTGVCFAMAFSVSLFFSTNHFSLGVLSSHSFRFRYNV